MASILEMPKLTDTMTEGIITRWLVHEGEPVISGEELLEIETDKANVTYESFENGYLIKIIVPDGQAVPLGQPIAVIAEKKDEDISSLLTNITTKKTNKTPTVELKSDEVQVSDLDRQKTTPIELKETINQSLRRKPSTTLVQDKQTGYERGKLNPQCGIKNKRVCISPIAKKIIKEKGILIDELKGTGPGNRIIKRDILEHLKRTGSKAGVAEYKDLPLTMMRKTIANRMIEAKNSIPHYYLTLTCNLRLLSDLRFKYNESVEKEQTISFNSIFIKIASIALLKRPVVNSSYQGDFIRQYNTANISVAVALEKGLVVPTLFHVEKKGLKQIGIEFAELVKKAREGKLAPDEMQGGTFCISNLGMFNIEEFSAVINPPQAAILALGKIEDAPMVEHGEIKIMPQMKATLSCDHRVIDGKEGAEFLSYFKSLIENPLEIVL